MTSAAASSAGVEHLEHGISVIDSGNLSAAAVQSSLSAHGAIYPTAMIGAPEITEGETFVSFAASTPGDGATASV